MYAKIRQFVKTGMHGDRTEFIRQFTAYYRLNRAGLTQVFKDTYFQLLFDHRPNRSGDPYTHILQRLHEIPRRQGDRILAASFTSKLVAVHDEAQPLYDRFVAAFFGITVPTFGTLEFRISGFVKNLMVIKSRYESWSQMPEITEILERIRQRHPGIARAHPVRICDFLFGPQERTRGMYHLFVVRW